MSVVAAGMSRVYSRSAKPRTCGRLEYEPLGRRTERVFEPRAQVGPACGLREPRFGCVPRGVVVETREPDEYVLARANRQARERVLGVFRFEACDRPDAGFGERGRELGVEEFAERVVDR